MEQVSERFCEEYYEMRDRIKQLQAENKRLREGLEEIEAVACGEQQIEADGDYDDGVKWIYDRTQALKENNQ